MTPARLYAQCTIGDLVMLVVVVGAVSKTDDDVRKTYHDAENVGKASEL